MPAIIHKALDAAFGVAQITELFRLSHRPVPGAPDGLTDAEAAPTMDGRVDTPSLASRVVQGVSEQLQRGLPLSLDAIPGVLDAIRHAKTQGLNDRLFLLEDALGLISRLPPGHLQQTLEDAIIGLLYDDLPHPPVNFVYLAGSADPSRAHAGSRSGSGSGSGAGAGASASKTPIRIEPIRFCMPHSLFTPPDSPDLDLVALSPTATSATSATSTGTTWTMMTTTTPTADEPLPPSPAFPATSSSINSTKYTTKYSRDSTLGAFRTPTGAGNNPHMPLLGASNTPYARSVSSLRPIPPDARPDPALVFDALLRRTPPPSDDPTVENQGHGQNHPSGISTLLFAFATLIVHTLFRTSPGQDKNLNLTSSYLDLSVLYGCNDEEMDSIRRKDGTGRIWEDTWADPRLLAMVPAVGALMVVFSRNHNYVATKLLEINENRAYATRVGPLPSTNYPPPPPEIPTPDNPYSPTFPSLSKDQVEDQDDDIFNRTRLINCAFFMNVILGDYLSGILGTFRDGSTWCLNPLEEIRHGGKTTVNRAEGNSVSVEFNLLYRWHATLSPENDEWLQTALKRNLPPDHPAQNNPTYEWTSRDYGTASTNAIGKHGRDPREWTFGGLERQPGGAFRSNELAKILHEATRTSACGFGPRGIPAVLKPIEVMSIEQARRWGVCTLNEFRQFFGLKKFESFEEWCSVGDIPETARRLYDHIDNLELYVGMQAEQAKPPRVGSGLCAGYTISRAILADAVSLTRGDRFLTTDLTPFNLTAWGYQDAARDTKNGSMGGAMCKLLFRTLPEYYPDGSIYAHFPFITPREMEKHLCNMGILKRYKTLPPPTAPIPHGQSVNTLKGVRRVLKDMGTFKTTYAETMGYLSNGYGFILAFDEPAKHAAARQLFGRALWTSRRMEEWAQMYERTACDLIEDRTWLLPSVGRRGGTACVDIVRDVLNVVPVHWVCEEIAGIPLKTKKCPNGIHTEQEVYGMLAVIFTFIFLNVNPETGWFLRENAKKAADVLQGYIKGNLEKLKTGILSLGGLRDSFIHLVSGQRDNSDHFLQSLLDAAPPDMTVDVLTYNVFGICVASTANWAMAATHVVNFYLDDARAEQKKHIEELVRKTSPDAAALLEGYAREALRLDPQAPGIFRKAAHDIVVDEEPMSVKEGERIFVSLAHANMDPDTFESPETIDPKRPRKAYSSFGWGEHTCLGDIFTEKTIPAVMRAIFSKRNVQRAPGHSGQLNRFRHNLYGTEGWMYMSAKGMPSPWPTSLVIQYDL